MLQTKQLNMSEQNVEDLLDDGGFEADDFQLQQLLGQLNFVSTSAHILTLHLRCVGNGV